MKKTLKIITVLFVTLLISCGGKEEKKEETFSYQKKESTEKKEIPKTKSVKASEKIDLANKGIGPITSVELSDEIDKAMVTKGAEIFKKMCTACHREGKKIYWSCTKWCFRT